MAYYVCSQKLFIVFTEKPLESGDLAACTGKQHRDTDIQLLPDLNKRLFCIALQILAALQFLQHAWCR